MKTFQIFRIQRQTLKRLAFLSIFALSSFAQISLAQAKGGTFDLVQILSDQGVKNAIQHSEIGEIRKLGDSTYQVIYGQCVLIAAITEVCTEVPEPPSCQLRVRFSPADINCKN